MPQNANAQRIIDVCNELAWVRDRLANAADGGEPLTEAAEAIGKVYADLWAHAGTIPASEKEAEWARLLAITARPTTKE